MWALKQAAVLPAREGIETARVVLSCWLTVAVLPAREGIETLPGGERETVMECCAPRARGD
ncbi:hypothetical protein CWC00_23475 [Pseudoalteromonas rubra]|nr:hypothetical protein CWC00_23475 [Pseudoalteromonas rubra]